MQSNMGELKLKRGRPSREQEATVTEAILKAATRLFLAQGYEASSIEAVAQDAGVFKNAVYKRFPNKEALFLAVMESKIAEWDGLAKALEDNPGETLEERLISHVRRILLWSSNEEVRAFRRLRQSLNPLLTKNLNPDIGMTAHRHVVEMIASDIRRYGAEEGQAAQHPERVAAALLGMMSGWLEYERQEEPVTAKAAGAYAEWAVNLIWKGRAAW